MKKQSHPDFSDNELLKSLHERTLTLIIYAISLVIFLTVLFLLMFPQTLAVGGGINLTYLPAFHAFLNGSCAVILMMGFVAVRNKKFRLHKTFMVSAFILSSIFLISYVIYHSQAAPTKFGGVGVIRTIYFVILISHIILAAGILPLALFTIARSWRGEFDKHKRLARWTFPLWLYVAITGVIVYFLIAPYYGVV